MSDRRRTLIVCPGRGSYDKSSLGYLQNRSESVEALLDLCDARRIVQGEPTIRSLDAAEQFRTGLHVAGEHASLLTFACSMADALELAPERYEVVGVVGNSMGFYTALACAGALPLEDAIELVDTMGAWQKGNVIGGQVLYPLIHPDWTPDADAKAGLNALLAELQAEGIAAYWSIDLGGYAVLGADTAGVKALLARLPERMVGERKFPIQLPLHSAFHTPLLNDTSERALDELVHLGWQPPAVPLIDGRGYVFRPRWADPQALYEYTLGHQVVAPFDFTTAVRTALHHCAPDLVVALGPGNALGGPLARVLAAEHWGGHYGKQAFLDAQRTQPSLLSFGVPEQRASLLP